MTLLWRMSWGCWLTGAPIVEGAFVCLVVAPQQGVGVPHQARSAVVIPRLGYAVKEALQLVVEGMDTEVAFACPGYVIKAALHS
jgi:hypothetical protein